VTRRLAALLLATCLAGCRDSRRFGFSESARSRLAFVNESGDPQQLAILENTGQGVCALDADGDGLPDLYLANGNRLDALRRGERRRGALFRNNGDGSFTDVTAASGLSGLPWGTGCTVADFDGDGRPDLLLLGYGTSALYRNLGGFRFEDVTERTGLWIPGWASSAAFADLDGDGRLDVVVSRYVHFDPDAFPRNCAHHGTQVGCAPTSYLPETTAVFRQTEDGRFEDVSASSGAGAALTRGFGVAALPLFDKSRLPDVYVACDQMDNRLFRNESTPGHVRLVEVGLETGAALGEDGAPESSMGLAIGDAFEEGRPALFVTNFFAEKNTLYRNRGDLFEDVTAATGLDRYRVDVGWGAALADLDGDSHLDVLTANGHVYPQVDRHGDPSERFAQPMRFFAGFGGGRFEEVSVPAFDESRPRRGLAVVDLNNDGRPDVVVQTLRGAPQLLWNRSGAGNGWVRFTLEGSRPRAAVGARVTVTLPDGSRRTAWSLPNQGYQSSQDARVLFGLGRFRSASSVAVSWPGGREERLGALDSGDWLLVEGAAPRRLRLRTFPVPD
jgi:enediyne biosynthesis protein E4